MSISLSDIHTIHMFTKGWLVGWLCLTSHRQRDHLETAAPFTVSCEEHEAQFLHRSHRESNPGLRRGSPLHYPCASPAPLQKRCLSKTV